MNLADLEKESLQIGKSGSFAGHRRGESDYQGPEGSS